MSVRKNGATIVLDYDHPDRGTGWLTLVNALGSSDTDFANGLLKQLVSITTAGQEPDCATANFALSVVKGLAPRDEMESMLAAQMAAVHMATMTFARRLAHVDNIPQQDSASNAFNKLARTYAMQMEALKRYRTGGEQRVSNFLLWQLAYTELYFTDTLWPDFGKEHLERAIAEFRRRERRYGGVSG